MPIRFVWCLVLIIRLNAGQILTNCHKSAIQFEKVIGYRPPSSIKSFPLYKNSETAQKPLTTECINRCRNNDECNSFILSYKRLECFWYPEINMPEEEFIIDEDYSWFPKICLAGTKCDKLWAFERIPGATLIGNDTKILPEKLSRKDCEQRCITERDFTCKSVKYAASAIENSLETIGICTLSDADRHLLPNSYRVSTYDDEYMENQCAVSENDDAHNDYCAYEEYDNVVLAHSDAMFDNKTAEECRTLCEHYSDFTCRSYSFTSRNRRCYINSEDTKTRGPGVLVSNMDATYFEKARCLNINVSCSESYMSIRYIPEVNFYGKLYMQGFSENRECYATGQGKSVAVTLKLPLLTSQCGILKAGGAFNRTLLSGTLIIQYNSFIQTQADRVIRVGCIFGNESKILVGTGVTVKPSFLNKGSTLINSTANITTSPAVQMRVVDFHTQEEAADSQIGQELQLIIELNDPNDLYDIWASHLVAMTEKGDESILLLDDRGCPTNLQVFPSLTKLQVTNGTQLVATFQAFKFATSPIVRFSVIVQFCQSECPEVECTNGIQSFGKRRRRRELKSDTFYTYKNAHVFNANQSVLEAKTAAINQMPLEYIMVVRDSKSKSDRLVWGNSNRILVAGYDYSTNEVCMDYSLVIGLIVAWIIVQLFIFISCVILIRRYKRYYEQECLRQSMEELHKNFGIGFSNLENRRVHWADNSNIM